ncbi:hypothetical protein [Xanthomonas massiliensis]|jgi:uncharacterized membrane protein YciS (DUF1049 family)|uniref:hypothetical protein n=1 Tax=Xanthomonas massiliensis TaxID=1720302 RepID=UPI000825002C|nr:hypothetical protein [Xanthomonas massiliensis]
MNIFRVLVLLAFLLVGLVIGALNSERLVVDLGVTSIVTSSGIAIIFALLAGVVLGAAIVLAAVVLPLYGRLRRANKQLKTQPVPPSPSDVQAPGNGA